MKKPVKKIISASLASSTMVRLEGSSSVERQEWNQFMAYWAEVATSDHANSFVLIVPYHSFIQSLEVLRIAWTSIGEAYQVQIGYDLKAKIKKSQSTKIEIQQILNHKNEIKIIDFQKLRLKRQLTEFQISSITKLFSIKSGANFSVPGSGKTTATLVLWQLLRFEKRVGKLLVIAPRSAFDTWKSEPSEVFNDVIRIEFYSGLHIAPEVDIVVTNYEQLESQPKLQRLKNWVKANQSMIVLDEAHRVKGGGNSVRWRACSELTPLGSRIDLLTGTPMPQGFDDLRNLFSLSWPEVSTTFFSDERLRNIPAGTLFVRTTKDELQLPPVELSFIPLPMGSIQAQIYSALRRSYVGVFNLTNSQSSFFDAKGRAVMTLIAAATNPGLMMGLVEESAFMGFTWPPKAIRFSTDLINVVESYSTLEVPPKYEWVRRYCQKASTEGRKVLVWSNFIGNLKALERILRPVNPVLIYGMTPHEDRAKLIDRFRNDPSCSVLLSNPQTLGEGVSLHNECHECIYIDRLYNAGLYLQSLDRIHRLGLPESQMTKVFVLQSTQSIDFRVSHRLEQKISCLSRALNDHGLVKSSIPDYIDVTPNELVGLDQLDSDDLFQHLSHD